MSAFRPSPIFYWCRWGCATILSPSLVMDIHPCWHLSQPQPCWLCCGSLYHSPQWDPFRLSSLSLSQLPPMESQEGTSRPLDPWPSVQPYLCPLLVCHGYLQGCCLTKSHFWSWSQPPFCSVPKHYRFSTVSHSSQPLWWTCPAGVWVHGPPLNIWGLFSLVTFFLHNWKVSTTLKIFCYYTYTVLFPYGRTEGFFLIPVTQMRKIVHGKGGVGTPGCYSLHHLQGAQW